MLTLDHLQKLAQAEALLNAPPIREFNLGSQSFQFGERPYLMGVINLSSDSWYRESVSLNVKDAVERGMILKAQGAHIVDVGAESTLAHARRVDVSEQGGMLLPVVRELAAQGVIVSVETYHPDVASQCLKADAKVINLTGTRGTDDIFRMAADHGAAVILCYVQGDNVREVSDLKGVEGIVPQMYRYFEQQLESAGRCGLDRIFIDPGMGFYYRNLQDSDLRVNYQMNVFLNTFRFRTLGWPVCHALPHAFEFFKDEVRCAESFMAVLALLGKTSLLRTHEVPKVRAVMETLMCFKSNS